MPFDRLVQVVDDWAEMDGRDDVLAQIGSSEYRPRHVRFKSFLRPREFREMLERSDRIVAHAGMGTILQALECGKIPLVFPRRAALGETRSDHQVATARRFRSAGLVRAALDEVELCRELSGMGEWQAVGRVGPHAPDRLVSRIRQATFGDDVPLAGS